MPYVCPICDKQITMRTREEGPPGKELIAEMESECEPCGFRDHWRYGDYSATIAGKTFGWVREDSFDHSDRMLAAISAAISEQRKAQEPTP